MYAQVHSFIKEMLWDRYYKSPRYNLILTGSSLMSHKQKLFINIEMDIPTVVILISK